MNIFDGTDLLANISDFDPRGTALEIFKSALETDITCYAVISGSAGIRRIPYIKG